MRILAITGGHRVDLDAFRTMLAAICDERGWVFTHAVQPEAQRWLTPEHRGAFDAILSHDIPGLALARGTEPAPVGPDAATAEALRAVLDAGQGFVFLHHALAGWPGWPGWADALGGRYHYAPGQLRGHDWPDSGFRYAHYTARPQPHPVTEGVPAFELDDELYCCPVFEDDVVALLRATDVEPGDFHETYHEVLGDRGPTTPPWQHPPASDLLGWAKAAGQSPLVYLQPGDGPSTFVNPHFRHLLANALAWVASPDAHEWATQHRSEITITTQREGTPWTSS